MPWRHNKLYNLKADEIKSDIINRQSIGIPIIKIERSYLYNENPYTQEDGPYISTLSSCHVYNKPDCPCSQGGKT